MEQRFWVLAPQMGAATAAVKWMVLHHLFETLHRQQLWPATGMVLLAAALATTALTTRRGLNGSAITGARLG